MACNIAPSSAENSSNKEHLKPLVVRTLWHSLQVLNLHQPELNDRSLASAKNYWRLKKRPNSETVKHSPKDTVYLRCIYIHAWKYDFQLRKLCAYNSR